VAERGGRVVAWDVDAHGLASLAEELPGISTRVCDLASRTEIAMAAAEARELCGGGPDVVVNNAGVVSGRPFLECSDQQVELTMAVNAMAPMWVAREFLPKMLEDNRGHLVTVASSAGFVGVNQLVDYCASKHAAVGFNEALRFELHKLGKRGVRTTCVCPFFIHTGMFEGVRTRFPWLLPILQPEWVADRIVWALARQEPMVICPWFVRSVFLCKFLFPTWLSDVLARFFGLSESMASFIGRRGEGSGARLKDA